jgi:hypothetical protein
MSGWVHFGLGLTKAFNSAMEAFSREQDRNAGRNEANLKARVEQDKIEDEAKDVWDSPNRGRFK